MSSFSDWTRRRFLSSTAAIAALRASEPFSFAQPAQRPRSAATSPEEITGKVRGLMQGHTARPSRYLPQEGGFAIRNGREFFNRPLYGPNNAFRVDAGDLPEFSFYLPGHGGNFRPGIASGDAAKWLSDAAEIVTTYRPGRMLYEFRDPLLQNGVLQLEVFTMGEGAGLYIRTEASALPSGLKLLWAFGGVSGRKGKRGGDIGCEAEPVSRFFQVRPEECRGNSYRIESATARLHSAAADLAFVFPPGSRLGIGDAQKWNSGWTELSRESNDQVALPVLVGSIDLASQKALYIAIRREMEHQPPLSVEIEAPFVARSSQLETIASTISVATPDAYINSLGGALSIAGDAIWDNAQNCVMHGAVAWRNPLAGWRGPYVLDALGWHERFKKHARHWIARQNTSPVTTGVPATGSPDPGSHLARSENMLHSRGDLSHNHYDMNLVFFDAVLRHLQWTGDIEFAKEIWPSLVLHLEWERRLFRRTYTSASGEQLPLYEAYACIWASDNLQYNGGGAAHATAYNYYANCKAAEIAHAIGEDTSIYERESQLIQTGMRELLWLSQQGTFGESKDILGPQTVYTSPALWSIYHTIDSEVASPREAWQMAVERLSALKRIPIHGENVPEGGWFMLSCTDWLPYVWSLNLLLLAENMHMALALWQTGMVEEAFQIFKGNLIDSMFQGLAPGNFHMTSELDAHRQEAQRDFGDPIGITSRALVEGLFGIKPDLLRGVVTIGPGFPATWNNASLHHRDINVKWERDGTHETFEVTSHFAKPISLMLHLRAPLTGSPLVKVNGSLTTATFAPEAVGAPQAVIAVPAGSAWKVEIEWRGETVGMPVSRRIYSLGEKVQLPSHAEVLSIDDPQNCMKAGRAELPGTHTVFAQIRRGDCQWWVPISFEIRSASTHAIERNTAKSSHPEMVDLSGLLRHQIRDIFRREYNSPRSSFCSLSIPQQGAGAWASFDTQPPIDDAGLYSEGGILQTPMGVPFRTPSERGSPNCLFLSLWKQDQPSIEIPLTGKAQSLFLLMAGSTFPQCSRMTHAVVRVSYTDGSRSVLELRNPETWWPIEQDYLLDDYLFVSDAPIPPRIDLGSGLVRTLDPVSFKGKGRNLSSGAANVLELSLDHDKVLTSLNIEVKLYGIVAGLLAATLAR